MTCAAPSLLSPVLAQSVIRVDLAQAELITNENHLEHTIELAREGRAAEKRRG